MKRVLRRRFSVMAGLAALVALVGAAVFVLACGPENYPSVHFNTSQPDFGAAPRPFSILSWGETPSRPKGCKPKTYRDWNEESYQNARWESVGKTAIANARRLESKGKLKESLPSYRNAIKHGIGDPAAVRDREEVVSEMRASTDRRLVSEYLSARRDYETFHWARAENRMRSLASNTGAGFLRAHALYVLGATEYDRNHFRQAGVLFEGVAVLYPHSPRREAALIMVPRSLLRSPVQTEDFPTTWLDKPLPGKTAAERSRKALGELLTSYPDTRFRADALGWLARCDYVLGRRVAAMEAYLRQFGSFTATSDRISAAASVMFTSRKLTAADSRQLRADLLRNRDLLVPYLDYRLYHSSPDKKDLAALADLATRAAGIRNVQMPSRISARLAEIRYLQGRYSDARLWANRALATGSTESRDLALYVRGAADRKSGRAPAAEVSFLTLIRTYPNSYLCGAARENLALICERRGRPDLALDEYFRMNYQEDIAYILDARMTTRQVAAYLASHPRHKQHDLLIYTLGIRQLRDNELAAAEKTLSRLSDAQISAFMTRDRNYWWESIHNRPRDPRKTARDLAHLERAVSKARGTDARAAALYEQASYFYTNRDLLFYNAALWHGQRSWDLGELWDAKAATAQDVLAVRRHHHEHEAIYRAREICLQIAQLYPKSPSAPKALYRAACASRSLADFSEWWRNESDRLALWHQAVRLMKDVYQKYPNDPLAKPAKKYATVFERGEDEASNQGMFEVARKQL